MFVCSCKLPDQVEKQTLWSIIAYLWLLFQKDFMQLKSKKVCREELQMGGTVEIF